MRAVRPVASRRLPVRTWSSRARRTCTVPVSITGGCSARPHCALSTRGGSAARRNLHSHWSGNLLPCHAPAVLCNAGSVIEQLRVQSISDANVRWPKVVAPRRRPLCMGRKPCWLLIKLQCLSSPPKRVAISNHQVPDTDMLPAEPPGLCLSWLTCCCSEEAWRTATTIAAESLLS